MQDFSEILKEFGENTIADIKYKMGSYGLGDSALAKSLDYEIDGTEIKITAAGYYPYAEKGRGPGGVPRNFEDILETWIVSRGIKPKDGNISKFASAICWNTIKHGSSLYRNSEKQRDFDSEAIEENLNWLRSKVGVFLLEN